MTKLIRPPFQVGKRTIALASFLLFYTCLTGQVDTNTNNAQEMPDQLKEQRNEDYKNQLEQYLQHWIIEDYQERADKSWNRDYSSKDAFERSVEDNRARWKALLNPPDLRKSGPLTKTAHPYLKDVGVEWVELPLGPISAQGILVFPPDASPENPVPLVVVQHGIGSYPETPFSLDHELYHEYARELLSSGFAVLAPMNLRSMPSRNYIERLCRLIDTTLPGIELERMQHLLDVVLEDPRVDPERIGMWGLSLGGMATMFWMPLEPRIKVGVVSAWFNHRRNKMALPDEKYVSFMVVDEEHAFFRGWLTEFTDSDVVSLICPRPLMIHHGKSDRIAYWPQVVEEFEIAKGHYEKLNISDRMMLDVFEGGHEARTGSGVPFLQHWLKP